MTITIVAVSWPGGGTLKLTCGPRVEVGSERPSIVGHRGSRQREESADGLLECGGPFDVAGPLGSGVAQGLRKNHLVQRANVPLQLVDGLGVCATITQRYPDTQVLVLTSSSEEWLILESVRQGAKGFVVKDVDLGELIRAIRSVHRGESAFDSRSASVVVNWMHGNQQPGAVAGDITPREREILALLAKGLSNVAIGQRLYISAATVKFHVGNLLHKLGARRRAEAVYTASKLGLI